MLKKINLEITFLFLQIIIDTNVFLKNIISKNNIEEESTLKTIIESVKKIPMKGTER